MITAKSATYIGTTLSTAKIDVGGMVKISGTGDQNLLYLNYKALVW